MAFVVEERDAPATELRGGRGTSLALINESTGSAIDVHVNVLRLGSGAGPYHYHSNAENIYYVLEGVGLVNVEGRMIQAGPGIAIWIGPNEKHAVENTGDSDLRLLEIKVPAHSDFILVEDGDAGAHVPG